MSKFVYLCVCAVSWTRSPIIMKTINLVLSVCLHTTGLPCCQHVCMNTCLPALGGCKYTCISSYMRQPVCACTCLWVLPSHVLWSRRTSQVTSQWKTMKQIGAGKREGWEPLTKGLMRRVEESRGCLPVRWDWDPGDKEMLNTSNPLWTYGAESRRHCPWPTVTLFWQVIQNVNFPQTNERDRQ